MSWARGASSRDGSNYLATHKSIKTKAVHLECTQCYINYFSTKLEKKFFFNF